MKNIREGDELKLLCAIVFFYLFFKGLNSERTFLAFGSLALSIAMLMWELFEVWSVVALI